LRWSKLGLVLVDLLIDLGLLLNVVDVWIVDSLINNLISND